jgi:hypothetical protein
MKVIKLLNGTTWDRETLLEQMMDDDFYYGNLGRSALSSSACKLLLQSPKTYHYVTKYGQEDSDAFTVGKLAHVMVLQPELMGDYEVIDVQSKNTKTWQEAKARGGKIITAKELKEAQRIADALLRNEQVLGYIQGCSFEVPEIGYIDGLPFRAKADIYSPGFIADLKTTTDLRNAFPYSAKKYGYDMQAYIYTRLFGVPIDKFIFIAIDKGSLDIGIYTISPEFLQSGKEKLEAAIALYKEFFLGVEEPELDNYTIVGQL